MSSFKIWRLENKGLLNWLVTPPLTRTTRDCPWSPPNPCRCEFSLPKCVRHSLSSHVWVPLPSSMGYLLACASLLRS